jgi:hypothetical protein
MLPAFFVFVMSFDGGIGPPSAWLLRIAVLAAPGVLASIPLGCIYFLKKFPTFYPHGAIAAVFLWCLFFYFSPPGWFRWLHQ